MDEGTRRRLPDRDRVQELLALPVEAVPVRKLKAGLSPRSGDLNEANIEALAEVIDRLPPILVHKESMTVIDGHHRLEAVRRAGHELIGAVLVATTLAEAAALAIVANVAHGLPLTISERKEAASRLIEATPDQSDRSIAVLCGLAPSTVAKVRARCLGSTTGYDNRLGVDGHRRGRCSDEVKERLAASLHDRPDQSYRTLGRDVGVSASTVSRLARRGAPRLGRGTSRNGKGSDATSSGVSATSDVALSSLPEAEGFVAWFDSHRIESTAWRRYLPLVPLSRVYEIADECRARAAAWSEMASALEHRSRSSAAH